MSSRKSGGTLSAHSVKKLQTMLNQLAFFYPVLPRLEADGLFGERTLEAVMVFQREFHPPVTGIVDQDTWNAIQTRWQSLDCRSSEPRPVRGFPSRDCCVPPGGKQEFLILPQAMLRVLARYLNGIADDSTDGFHGPSSVANVRWLQRAAGLAESGTMDWQTWEALSHLYEIFIVKEQRIRSPAPAQSGGPSPTKK